MTAPNDTVDSLKLSAKIAAAGSRADLLTQAFMFTLIHNSRDNDNNAIYLLAAAGLAATLISQISKDQKTPLSATHTFFLEALTLALKEPTP